MATRIQGITIKLKGDTTELQNSLNQVDKASRDLNKELKQINTSLKFHPGNSDLIAQKQRVLAESVENTKKKLDDLKRAQEQTSKEMAAGDAGKQSQYDALTREIKKTEDQLKSMSRELAATSSKASQFGEAMQRAGDKMQETGGKIKGVGDDLTTKVTLPLAAVGAAGFAMAADLQDAMGATDQIFKSAAGEMKNWASSLESFYGIAEGEALQYANTMGAMLQNIGGLSEAEAAKQAQILTELAGDLSAMFGGTTESAIQALTGALKGNNSMLDNYGMGVNEATIKTKAMEMGLIAEGEQLDLAGKQAATLALIMEQTADAQGQAGREAEGASGTMKAFATEAKNLATEIGNVLLPIITPLINKAKEFVAGFKSMDSGTKELIVKIGLFAAAIGPVLVVLGTLITSVGTVTGAIGGVITAFSAGGAAAAALGAPLTGLLGPLGLVIAGVAAVGVAAWNLAQDAIPAVDLFGEGVSDATATAVGAFLELEEGATTALNQMVWSGQEVTEQYKETIGGAFTQMKDTILQSLTEQKEQSATTLQEMFANNAQLSEEEKQRMLAALDEELTSKESKIAEGEARVQEILALASEEKRALTQAEKDEINRIQEEMRTVAVQTLSESEAEQLAIMESLKANAGTLSAQQAAEVVQNSVKQKDEAIAAANEEYSERLKAAALLRADGTKESAEMADAIVKEATRQRDEAVKQAEGMHADVVAEAKAQAGEHVNEVDWSTGEIKSKWQVMKEDVTAKAKALGEQVSSDFETMKTNASRKVEELKTKATEAYEGIRKGAEEKIDAAKKAITDGIEAARETVAGYVDRFKSVGRDIIDGIASGIRNGIETVTSAARNVAERALTAAKNFLGIRSPSRKMRDEVGAMMSEGLAIGIESKTYEVEQASKGIAETSMEAVKKNLHPKTFEQSLDGIIRHLLSTEKEFLKFYDTFGLGGEEMFERLRQGGNVAMTEVIDLINFMSAEGYDAAEIGKYMGDNWHDAMTLIIDKYTEWDMANQQTVYSIEEMNAAFSAMVNVGRQGSQAVTADIENIGETAKRVAEDNSKQINSMLSGMRVFAMANKEAFIGAMEDMGMYGVDVWDNIAAGGKFADGVMASLVKRILSMEDQTKAMDIANRAFASHFRKDMGELMLQAGEWESEYNVGSWALDQNKLLALSLEEVEAAAKKVRESIKAKNFAEPTLKDALKVGEMISAGMADGIVARKGDVGSAMQEINDHVLKNIEALADIFEKEGLSMEETFQNLKAGGVTAMEELFNVMAMLQDYGYDSTEMSKIFGSSWSEALQLIVWNMTGWDMQTQRTTYNIDEMNKSFAAMLGVGQAGTSALEADLENLGATAEAVAKQSERAIMQHLETLHSYVSGNKQAFIAAMDSIGYFGDDVWNNIAHGGSDANGVIAAVIKHLNGITDEAQRSAVGAAAFGNHWKSALNGMIEDVGMWESEYNVGSWAIDQNKLLSVSLEEVEAAAKKVRESIKAENFAEPIKDDSIKNVKEKMKVELTEIEDFTKQTLDGVKKQFDETFADIQKSVVSNLKDKVVPALKDSLKSGLDVVYGFTQDVFDDFEHVFYELRDVVVVNLREHVTPGMRNQLQQMLQIMSGSSQAFYDTGQLWMRALADGIRSGMINVQSALQAIPAGQVAAGGTGVQWYDSGGIFRSPTIIGVGEKRPEFVGALDDLKTIVAEVIDRKGVSTAEGVVITGNTFNVRTDDDIRRIAEELKRLQDREKRGGR